MKLAAEREAAFRSVCVFPGWQGRFGDPCLANRPAAVIVARLLSAALRFLPRWQNAAVSFTEVCIFRGRKFSQAVCYRWKVA